MPRQFQRNPKSVGNDEYDVMELALAAPPVPGSIRLRGDSTIRSLVSTPPQLSSSFQAFRFVSTDNPEVALQDIEVFRLFRHYMLHLATWYDLNDHCRHFGDRVPVMARRNPLLLSAILAFSAASICHSNDGGRRMVEKAEFYHLQSIRILLRVTSTIQDAISNGEMLAAICLLRSFEIISHNLTSQNHLQGCYSILASHSIQLQSESGLARAAFWNYLREDITMALIERRRLMIDLSDEHLPQELEFDDDYANHITVRLGQVINKCFSDDLHPFEISIYDALKHNLKTWYDRLPASFTPITMKASDSSPGSDTGFPFIGTLHGWHAAARQYYQTAMIILLVAKPNDQEASIRDKMTHMLTVAKELEDRASEICALALSSDSEAVWVNSFGPIAFCGCFLREQVKLNTIIEAVQDWGGRTGWPVSKIIRCLEDRGNATV
ncbi:hypothetical protein N7470_010296 [Penicillium chermesinum]|nr:hypothetical protein N7470_010296 [Penicillium chermesinum]